jgi:hypothetical protein
MVTCPTCKGSGDLRQSNRLGTRNKRQKVRQWEVTSRLPLIRLDLMDKGNDWSRDGPRREGLLFQLRGPVLHQR